MYIVMYLSNGQYNKFIYQLSFYKIQYFMNSMSVVSYKVYVLSAFMYVLLASTFPQDI